MALERSQVRIAAGPPHPGPAGGLPDQPGAVDQGQARPVRRARPVGGGAPGGGARGRDQGLPAPGILDGRHHGRGRQSAPVHRQGGQARRQQGRAAERGRRAQSWWKPWRRSHPRVNSVDRKERRKNAPPPFITSKLQQEASSKLRYSPKRTMGAVPAALRRRGDGRRGTDRSHHVHAYRLDAHFRRRPGRGARLHRREIRRGLPAARHPSSTRPRSRPRTPTRPSAPPP